MKKYKVSKLLQIASSTLLTTALLGSIAQADWRSDMGVFRIGIATQYGEPFKPSQYELFRLEMSKALNMPVEIFQARDASALIDATASSRIEYAIVSALGYATLEEMCSCVTPLAAPISRSGADSVRSALIVNPENIQSLDQLAGKRIALGPETSLTGNIIPFAQFSVGNKSLADMDVQIVQANDTEQALKLFLAGDVDAFFGWQAALIGDDTSYSSLMNEHLAKLPNTSVGILWRSTPIRFGPHVLRNNLPSEVATTVRKTLLALEAQAPLAFDAATPDLAGGLTSVAKTDYRSAISLVRDLVSKQEKPTANATGSTPN